MEWIRISVKAKRLISYWFLFKHRIVHLTNIIFVFICRPLEDRIIHFTQCITWCTNYKKSMCIYTKCVCICYIYMCVCVYIEILSTSRYHNFLCSCLYLNISATWAYEWFTLYVTEIFKFYFFISVWISFPVECQLPSDLNKAAMFSPGPADVGSAERSWLPVTRQCKFIPRH